MSHYTIDYSTMPEAEKQAQAIDDIIAYLGRDRFTKISDALRPAIADGATVDDLRLPLSFAGVQGYPVVAWIAYLSNPTTDPRD